QRLGAVRQPQRIWIEAGFELEDELPDASNSFSRTDTDIGLTETARCQRPHRLTIHLLNAVRRALRKIPIEWRAVGLVPNTDVDGPIDGNAVPAQNAVRQEEFGYASARLRWRGGQEMRCLCYCINIGGERATSSKQTSSGK